MLKSCVSSIHDRSQRGFVCIVSMEDTMRGVCGVVVVRTVVGVSGA
jgi:hypothetical protein